MCVLCCLCLVPASEHTLTGNGVSDSRARPQSPLHHVSSMSASPSIKQEVEEERGEEEVRVREVYVIMDSDDEKEVRFKQEPTLASHAERLKVLLQTIDIQGVRNHYQADGAAPNPQRRCVLSRFTDETLRKIWELVKGNYDELLTTEHIKKNVSACHIWKEVPKVAGFENGYPVLMYRKSVSKFAAVPYLKIHQLAVFTKHGVRTGLGEKSDVEAAHQSTNAVASRLTASHLCHNKPCINPDHLWPERSGPNRARNLCKGPGKCNCFARSSGAPRCLLNWKPSPVRKRRKTSPIDSDSNENEDPNTEQRKLKQTKLSFE